MTDPIDAARQEGIALGLAMAKAAPRFVPAQVWIAGEPFRDAVWTADIPEPPIPPHVAAARVLQRYVDAMSPPQQGRVSVTMFEADDMESGYLDTFRAALEQIANEGE